MKLLLSRIVMIAVMILSSSAYAEIYVWEDATGSHAASDPKDVPPEVLKRYGYTSPSNEEKNIPQKSDIITTETNDKIDKDNIKLPARYPKWVMV